MSYELTGTIKKIFERQDFPSGFYKQEFVVTTEDRYPQDIKLDCLKEKTEMLESLKEGDRVTVHFDVRGREWNERFFVDLAAWKISAAGDASGEDEPAAKRAAPTSPATPAGATESRKKKSSPPPEDPGPDEFAEEDIPF